MFSLPKSGCMKISCIITYYNERKRIHAILEAIRQVKQIDEILLIDDGSTDGGVYFNDDRASHFRIEKNGGKSAAMRFGFSKSACDIVLFLDADLSGITPQNIDSLITPLIEGMADITISQREYFSFFDVVSGERALIKDDWKDFFANDSFERNASEIIMNRYVMLNNLKLKMVKWPNVKQEYKSMKIGFFRGMWTDIRYVRDWMKQMGSMNFSTTYLFFWIIILSGRSSQLSAVYKSLYALKYPHLRQRYSAKEEIQLLS